MAMKRVKPSKRRALAAINAAGEGVWAITHDPSGIAGRTDTYWYQPAEGGAERAVLRLHFYAPNTAPCGMEVSA